MPAIRHLALKTVCRLDGLERYPSLEELTVGGSFQDADPVCDLPHLKHLTPDTEGFQDVSPLIRLPELRHLTVSSRKPRDYSPLVEAPKLREITATGDGAQVNEMELVAINAGLSLWDEDFALPEPRPYQGPLHIICFDDTASLNAACREDYGVQTRHDQPYCSQGMKKAEADWFERELGRIAEATLGLDWRKKGGHTTNRCVWISQFADAERIPELLEALRPLTAKSRIPRTATIFVSIDPDEEHEWEDRPEAVERYEDEVSYEQRRAEQLDMLERQYRFQLRQQTEKDIDPESFSQPLVEPKPVPMPLEMLLLDDDREDEFADDEEGEDEDEDD